MFTGSGKIFSFSTNATLLKWVLHTGKNYFSNHLRTGIGTGIRSGIEPQIDLKILVDNPDHVSAFFQSMVTLKNWFYGQAMRQAGGKANPAIIKNILRETLSKFK